MMGFIVRAPHLDVAYSMEILRTGKSGMVLCSVQVGTWELILTLEPYEDLAAQDFGVCERCQIDTNRRLWTRKLFKVIREL